MLSDIWRLLVALCDWRALWRLICGRSALDVVFVTNLRDDSERRQFFGRRISTADHAGGPRFYAGGVAGRVRGINVTAAETLTAEGRRRARHQFIEACKWAERRGAKTVLLAASTKRLFGRDGNSLKAMFPRLLFTIGDNGTASLLWRDVRQALDQATLAPGAARVLVICPYGILGSAVTRQLVGAGYEVVGFGTNQSALEKEGLAQGIVVTTSLEDVGAVDAVVACTHHAASKLDCDGVESLRRPGSKLLVIDVSEPANLDQDSYSRCRDHVLRRDAGNGFSPQLDCVLGFLPWSRMMLARGVVFGCFAEAMALTHAIHRMGHSELRDLDWFVVDDAHQQHIEKIMPYLGFVPPEPCCFGRKIESLRLSLREEPAVGTDEGQGRQTYPIYVEQPLIALE